VIAAAVAAVIAGTGLVLVLRAAVPARRSLGPQLAALTDLRTPASPDGAPLRGVLARVGQATAAALDPDQTRFSRLRADLDLLERPFAGHLVQQGLTAALGVAMALSAAAVLIAGGVSLPAGVWAVAALALGGGGALAPNVAVRSQATERRQELREALGGYLDLASVVLAAGEGIESALRYAAGIGGSWAHEHLRRALDEARLTRESSWDALGRLGRRLGVEELVELASATSLAGTEGAKVRQSLQAKAAALRAHEMAKVEARAGAMTEGMSFPLALLLVGFVVLIGYPALSQILAGLGPGS
jgi:Flp pilus assembly protein TadB